MITAWRSAAPPSQARPFSPRQLRLGGWGQAQNRRPAITTKKGQIPGAGSGVFFQPPNRPGVPDPPGKSTARPTFSRNRMHSEHTRDLPAVACEV